jgi:hypothetical protein
VLGDVKDFSPPPLLLDGCVIIRKYDFLSRIPKGRVQGIVVQCAGVRIREQGKE